MRLARFWTAFRIVESGLSTHGLVFVPIATHRNYAESGVPPSENCKSPNPTWKGKWKAVARSGLKTEWIEPVDRIISREQVGIGAPADPKRILHKEPPRERLIPPVPHGVEPDLGEIHRALEPHPVLPAEPPRINAALRAAPRLVLVRPLNPRACRQRDNVPQAVRDGIKDRASVGHLVQPIEAWIPGILDESS